MVFLTMFGASLVANHAAAKNCTTNAELINQSPETVDISNICDDLGNVYFVSSAEALTTEMLEYINSWDIGPEFAYYDSVRVFLMKERSGDFSENMSDQLSPLLIASYLILGSPEYLFAGTQEISDRRKDFYTAYVLIKYWQYHEIRGSDAAMLKEVLGDIMFDENLTVPELNCFIESDIPTLKLETVFESSNYLACIQRS